MRKLTFVLAMAVIGAACSQSPTSPEFAVPLTVNAVKTGEPLSSTHLKGEHEVPARETQAQGQAIMKVAEDGQSISFKLIASNIENVIAAHIHIGSATVAGPVVVFLYGTVPSGAGRHDGILSEGTFTAADFSGPLAGQPCLGTAWCDYGSCSFKRGVLMECRGDVWISGGAPCS